MLVAVDYAGTAFNGGFYLCHFFRIFFIIPLSWVQIMLK